MGKKPIGDDSVIYIQAEYLKLNGHNADTWYPCTPLPKTINGSEPYIPFEDVGSSPHDFGLNFRLT